MGGTKLLAGTLPLGDLAESWLRALEAERKSGQTLRSYRAAVDAFYRRAKAHGIEPQFEPRDAPWNERYFHLTDPDGHELSFARPL